MIEFKVNKAKGIVEISGSMPLTVDKVTESKTGAFFLNVCGGFSLDDKSFLVSGIDLAETKKGLQTQVSGIEPLVPYFTGKVSLGIGFKASKSSKIDLSFLK